MGKCAVQIFVYVAAGELGGERYHGLQKRRRKEGGARSERLVIGGGGEMEF